ncbi:MAG: GAF domain-containing protein [Candidatus Sericytochromatia bacterium]|nr:GAF domain-containing protein [Candidatus Sericytochromatia bacterium]
MTTPVLPARYTARRSLGEGGMGEVHLVHDQERDLEMALKCLHAHQGAGDATYLFRQEFGAMMSLRHPNLVAGYDYGVLADDRPYFTMEAVMGPELAPTRQDEAAIRAWLPGLLAGLDYLHGRGFVHGDLKPENIRFTADGTPKLMDLGLLTPMGRRAGAIRGSVWYMAPEVIQQGPLDARADLYALGAILFQVLTGRPPFTHEDTLVLLRQHLEAPVPPLRDLAPNVSPELAELVLRLLAKRPAQRPTSAGAVLAELGLPVSGASCLSLLGAPIIGREGAQARLAEWLAADTPRMVLSGPVGVGKSRLLEAVRAEAMLAGQRVVRLQGAGPDAPPYQALQPLIRSWLAVSSPTRDRLAPILVKLMPELDVPPAPAIDSVQERARLHGALAELAREQLPSALWIVDDGDRLDPASRELLDALRRQGDSVSWRWLEACDALPEAAGEPFASLPLGPLTEAAVLDLARALLGQDSLPTPVVIRLPQLSGGIPATVEGILTHWLQAGALFREGAGWVASAEEAFALPADLSLVLDQRLASLSETARQLASLAAVLGARGSLPLLAAVAALDELAWFNALAALEAADCLILEAQEYRFARPLQALTLAHGVPEAQRREWAGAAAAWLQARWPQAPEDPAVPLESLLALARFGLAGASPLSALPWVRAVADRLIALFALEVASELLLLALAVPELPAEQALPLQLQLAEVRRHQGRSDDALSLLEGQGLLVQAAERGLGGLARVTTSYGVLLMTKARYADALVAFERAAELAQGEADLEEQVRAGRFAGRTCYFMGQNAAALSHLERAVNTARGGGLEGPLASALGVYGYVLAASEGARLSEGLALLTEAADLHRAQSNAVALAEMLSTRGSLLLTASRFGEARATFTEVLPLAGRLGIPVTVMTAQLNLAAVALECGELVEARRQAEAVLQLAGSLGRRFYLAHALGIRGLVGVLQGDLASGWASLEESLGLALEMGNKVLEAAVRVRRLEALLVLGRASEAQTELAAARRLVQESHSHEHDAKLALGACLIDLLEDLRRAGPSREAGSALLAIGTLGSRPDTQARLAAHVEQARGLGAVPLAHAQRWQGALALYAGDAPAALPALASARGLAEQEGLVLLGAELDGLLAWARAANAADEGLLGPLQAALVVARSQGASVQLHWLEAALAELQGEPRARREAARAVRALAEGLSGEHQAAWQLWPERSRVLATRPVPPSAADARLAEVLELASTLDPLAGHDNVVQAALRMLVDFTGAERAFLLRYDDAEVSHRAFYGMTPQESEAFSVTLADQVYWSGEAVYIEDVQADARLGQQLSIQALGVRTVFGLPLRWGGEVIGVIMADSREVQADFTSRDLPLGLALADQVARALHLARELERADTAVLEGDRLFALALATAGARDLETFLRPVAAEALALTGADRCFLVTGETLVPRAAFDAQGQWLPAGTHELSTTVCRWVLEHGESLYLPDASSDEGFQHQKSVMALALRMVFAVPVSHDGERLGVLYLHSGRVGREDPALLRQLARLGELVGAFLARSEA